MDDDEDKFAFLSISNYLTTSARAVINWLVMGIIIIIKTWYWLIAIDIKIFILRMWRIMIVTSCHLFQNYLSMQREEYDEKNVFEFPEWIEVLFILSAWEMVLAPCWNNTTRSFNECFPNCSFRIMIEITLIISSCFSRL